MLTSYLKLDICNSEQSGSNENRGQSADSWRPWGKQEV